MKYSIFDLKITSEGKTLRSKTKQCAVLEEPIYYVITFHMFIKSLNVLQNLLLIKYLEE